MQIIRGFSEVLLSQYHPIQSVVVYLGQQLHMSIYVAIYIIYMATHIYIYIEHHHHLMIITIRLSMHSHINMMALANLFQKRHT